MDASIIPSQKSSKKKTCIDCGVSIGYGRTRCWDCYLKSNKPHPTCIDCGAQIGYYIKRCAACYKKTLPPKSTCIDCGITLTNQKTVRCSACHRCKKKAAKTKRSGKCLDCGKSIRSGSRCRACWGKNRLNQKGKCVDCGSLISKVSTRCRSCSRTKREPNKICIDCGVLPAARHYNRCNACLYQLRKLKHKCANCGAAVDPQSTHCNQCVNAGQRVNGSPTSKQQQAIFEMVGGIQNYRIGRLSVDIALQLPMAQVCIEYDSFYWHGNRLAKDKKRANRLIEAGWKVLSIKAKIMIPTFDQIQGCIFDLLAGADYAEIVMPDWGKGKAR